MMKIKKIGIIVLTFALMILGSSYIPKALISLKLKKDKQAVITESSDLYLSDEQQVNIKGKKYDPDSTYFYKIKVINYYTAKGLSYNLSRTDTLQKQLYRKKKD